MHDATGVLSERNSTNAQQFNIYNTYTSSASYERAELNWQANSNVFTIQTTAGSGGGTLRNIALEPSGGNVGIGTTGPGATLEVNGTLKVDSAATYSGAITTDSPYIYLDGATGTVNSTGGPFIYGDANNTVMKIGSAGGGLAVQNYAGTDEAFFATSGSSYINGGNVGIGTTGPSTLLEVAFNDNTFSPALEVYNPNTGGDAEAKIELNQGTSGAGYIDEQAGSLYLWNAGSNNTYFYNNSGYAMTIASNDDVGIGTTSPNVLLTIRSNSESVEDLLSFYNNSGTNYIIGEGNVADGQSLFLNGNSGRQLTITASGNVGIGTTSPGYTLQVNGTTYITGSTGIGGTASSSISCSSCSPTSLTNFYAQTVYVGGDDAGEIFIGGPYINANGTIYLNSNSSSYTHGFSTGYGVSIGNNLSIGGDVTSGTWEGTPIGPTYGGIGISNPTAHDVLVGEGSSNVTAISPSTSGYVLTSNGASSDPSFQAFTGGSFITTVGTITSGTWEGSVIGATYGGTGQNSSSSTGIAQVSSGTWSFSTALANGTTATTQSETDTSTKIATDAFVADIASLADLTSAASLVTVGNITTGTWNTSASESGTGVLKASNSSTSSGSSGVLGVATSTATTTAVYGVEGTASTADGIGVYGVESSTGYAIEGNNISSGSGGYFTSSSGYALVTGSGNVGIGTTSPSYPLDVENSLSGINVVRINATGSGSNGLYVSGQNYGIYDSSGINYFAANVGIGTTSPSALLSLGASGPIIDFYTTSNSYNADGARIIGSSSGSAWSTSYIDFQTHAGGTSSFTDDMTIKAGNVGIGTLSPAYALDIPGSNADHRVANTLIGAWPASSSYAFFGNSTLTQSNSANYALLQDGSGNTFLNAASGETLYLRNGNGTEAAVTSSGVGIGTASPSAPAHVYSSSGSTLRIEDANQGPWALQILNDTYTTSWGDSFEIYQDNSGYTHIANAGTSGMVFGGSGYVGIGTNPSEPLEVYSSAGGVDAIYGYATATNSNAVYGYNSGSGSQGYLALGSGIGVEGVGSSSEWGGDFSGGYGVVASNTAGYYTYLDDSSWGVYTNGNIYTSADTYSDNYWHNSDRRLKTDIRPIAGLDIIEKLAGVQFKWKKDGAASAGVIAQDVEKVMPEAVSTNTATGMKTVSYDALLAPLIEAVKQLKAENDDLKTDNENLKATINVIKADNDNLSAEEQKLEDRVNALERARRN